MQKIPGFANLLIGWYQIHKRDLPWRHTSDPYLIWVSEIIMQQTRVQQGLPYYDRFTKAFDTVQKLASAPLDTLLRLWQGLGYYSRARNMHFTACQLVEKYNGIFPGTFKGLLELKGVGRYTAAAIASFAYNEKVPVVDGNVIRVISRVFGVQGDVSLPYTLKLIEDISASHIHVDQPGIYNQAIMEFGALYCKPVKPDCPNCIFNSNCFAYQNQIVHLLPLKLKKVKIKNRNLNYIIFTNNGLVALKQRTGKDIWNGLFEYFLIESSASDSQEFIRIEIEKLLGIKVILNQATDSVVHVLTHQRLSVSFFTCKINDIQILEALGYRFYSNNEVEELPKSTLILNFINNKNNINLQFNP